MYSPRQDGLRIAEYQLKYALHLKTVLEALPKLTASLEVGKSEYFKKALKVCSKKIFFFFLLLVLF